MDKHAILVTGSREWNDREMIEGVLRNYQEGTVLIHGDAIGADLYADDIAQQYRFMRVMVPLPDWKGGSGSALKNKILIETLNGYRELGYMTKVLYFCVTDKTKTRLSIVNLAKEHDLDYRIYTLAREGHDRYDGSLALIRGGIHDDV